MGRGALIIFEGGDRSGKSTQARLLNEVLSKNGTKTKCMHFPDRTTPIGIMINSYLSNASEIDDRTIHLLFTANRWEAELVGQRKMMRKNLENGVTLLIDRYLYSGICFSAAKESMEYEWCKNAESGLPLPDIVFYLKTSAEVASLRKDYGNERYEKINFQAKVIENFDKMAKECKNFKVMDSTRTIEDLSREIETIATKIIENTQDELAVF